MSKKILIISILAIAALTACGQQPQSATTTTIPPADTTTTTTETTSTDTNTTQAGAYTGILNNSSGVLLMRDDGSSDPLTATKKLDDGTTVSSDATVVRPDGRIFKLAPESSIKMDGTVTSGDALIPDAKNTKGFTLKNGVMSMITTDGKSYPLTEYMMLNDKSYLEQDGSIRMADGTGKQLEEGQTVNLDGKITK